MDRRWRGQAKLSYQPLDQKELDQIAALVRSTIGFDAKRGDQARGHQPRIRRTRPAGSRGAGIQDPGLRPRIRRESSPRTSGLSVLAILFLLLVLRPLVSRAVEAMAAQAAEGRRLVGEAGGPGAADRWTAGPGRGYAVRATSNSVGRTDRHRQGGGPGEGLFDPQDRRDRRQAPRRGAGDHPVAGSTRNNGRRRWPRASRKTIARPDRAAEGRHPPAVARARSSRPRSSS